MLGKSGDGYIHNVPAPDNITLPVYAVEQTGGWVLAAFKQPDKYIGQSQGMRAPFCSFACLARSRGIPGGPTIDHLLVP